MKTREAWLADAKAKAKEVWREQNRALARKRTEALERQKQDALGEAPHPAGDNTGPGGHGKGTQT